MTLSRPRWAKQHAEQFTAFYYNTFDQDRKSLAALYVRIHPESEDAELLNECLR